MPDARFDNFNLESFSKPKPAGLLVALTTKTLPDYEILESIPVSPVWSAVNVPYAMYTGTNQQFVAFYDADLQMVAGQRSLNSHEWTFQKLPTWLSRWDSHNYIEMMLDDEGYIHISGNMHVSPLIYFRSEKPYDVTSLKQFTMTGEKELTTTYPVFFRGPTGELIFTYRDGSSGSGDQIANIYDPVSKTWRRLIDSPLTDGQGLMNAYLQTPPVLGSDGWFHLSWVWRDTYLADSNHDLCYARSKDLIHWETAAGTPIELPLRLDTPGVIVDPVPVKQGMLNGNGKIGFDSQGRVILSYHKFDANGKTQLYNARLEGNSWKIYQTSDWDYRWYFSGGGTIIMDIRIYPVTIKNGELRQSFSHIREPAGIFVLDEATLKPIRSLYSEKWPAELTAVRSVFPEMRTSIMGEKYPQNSAGDIKYILRWESLPNYRDQARPEPWPEPSMLEMYKVKYLSK